MYRLPDAIESITVLAACDKHLKEHEGDDAVTDAILDMASDILDVSPDRIFELMQDNEATINIINETE